MAVEDYYGRTVVVEDLMGSAGPMVDVDVRDDNRGLFGLRFTAEEACNLADELVRAAGFPQKATRP